MSGLGRVDIMDAILECAGELLFEVASELLSACLERVLDRRR